MPTTALLFYATLFSIFIISYSIVKMYKNLLLGRNNRCMQNCKTLEYQLGCCFNWPKTEIRKYLTHVTDKIIQ